MDNLESRSPEREGRRQLKKIQAILETIQDELKAGSLSDEFETVHLRNLINHLDIQPNQITGGQSYVILENTTEKRTPKIFPPQIVEETISTIAKTIVPAKLAATLVQYVLKRLKRFLDPSVDITQGHVVLRLEDGPVAYHSFSELLRHLVKDLRMQDEDFPLILPNRSLRPDVRRQLFQLLNLRAEGPSHLEVLRDGTEIKTTHYAVGIAPLFEVVEEVVTENTRRELRRSLILRRRQ